MNSAHIYEYILYGVICYFPFMLFAYYPLRYFSRFKTIVVFALEMAFAAVEVLFFLVTFRYFPQYYGILIVAIVVLNIFAYKLLFKISLGRVLFNLLLIVNVANFTIIAAEFLAHVLFPGAAGIYFHWTNSLSIAIIEVAFVLPSFFVIKHFSDHMIRDNSYNYIWRVAWLVPLILSSTGFVMIYGSSIQASSDIELYAKQTILCVAMLLCTLLIYAFIAMLIRNQHDVLKLETDLHHQSLQQMQLQGIEKQIKDTRVIRHDMRHHVTLMCNYVDQGEYDKLREYLHQYNQTISQIAQLHYTDNIILNTLLVYYADLCRSSQITFEAKLALPEKMPMQDNEITIMFSNLLENACQACLEMSEKQPRFIRINAVLKANRYLFTIDNSYNHELKTDRSGNFLTTKEDGSGIGIHSVKEIVSKYNGFIQIQPEPNVFNVSISIPNETAATSSLKQKVAG